MYTHHINAWMSEKAYRSFNNHKKGMTLPVGIPGLNPSVQIAALKTLMKGLLCLNALIWTPTGRHHL